MTKGLKLIYSDGSTIDIDISEEITISFTKTEISNRIRLQRIFNEDLKDKKFLNNLFEELSMDGLQTVEYIINNNTVNYISGYKLYKKYELSDSLNGKLVIPNVLYEILDITKEVE